MPTERERFFFDTEFIEDGKTIELISIGCVAEDYRDPYYACCLDTDLSRASPWVREHVIPHLPPYSDPAWRTKAQIREDLLTYWFGSPQLARVKGMRDLEFWTYYGDYDWVVLCQLWGRMIDLPPGMPRFAMDLKMLSRLMGDVDLPKQTDQEHVAINDAMWVRDTYFMLTNMQKKGTP